LAHRPPYVKVDDVTSGLICIRRSVIYAMDAQGDRLFCERIRNDSLRLLEVVSAAGVGAEVVIEATYGWYWAVDLLRDAGFSVHLAHPSGNDWGKRRVKNDERDARDLADLLRLGRLAEAWIAPPAVREARELVRYRARSVLRLAEPRWSVDVGNWLRVGDAYFNAHYRLVLRTLLIGVGVGLTAAVLAALVGRTVGKGGTIKHYNAWHSVFSKGAYAPTDTSSVCVTRLDGTRYFGVVEQWSDEAATWDERDIVLRLPTQLTMPRSASGESDLARVHRDPARCWMATAGVCDEGASLRWACRVKVQVGPDVALQVVVSSVDHP
jgi:hypothetical protein